MARIPARLPPTITWVGHSTVSIELDGVRILTDPLLRGRMAHIRRITPAPRTSDLVPVDAVLVSHAHHDHLDLPSLRRIGRDTRVLAAAACGRLLRRNGFTSVTEVAAGDRLRVGDVEVLVVPALHDGRRYPVGPRRPAVGFVLVGSQRIYFAGDTDVFEGMRTLTGGVDLALLPVWGWGPRLPAGHMDPLLAARAAAIVEPRLALPIHWGTYAAPRVAWLQDPSAPAREFKTHAHALAPGVDVRILAPGEELALKGSAAGR